MKLLPFLFGVFLFLTFPTHAIASENWIIESFKSDISVLANGKVELTETIDVDFGSQQKHGIFRDIPYVYEFSGGDKIYTEVDIENVSMDDLLVSYETSQSGGYIRLKIGDSDKTISGKHSYNIKYFASGVLSSFEDHDELYWNVTGGSWPVSISSAQVTVTLPADGITQVTCYQGAFGSKEKCEFEQTSKKSATFSATNLGVNEGLSVVVGYTKGLVPIITVEPPKTIFDSLFTLPNFLALGATLVLGISLVVWLWFSRGRDYWSRKRYLGDTQAKHEVKPVGSHETIVVEYTPPENLRPVQIGTLVDERADTLDVSATIIDLATRGFLTIKEEPKKWVFGSRDYELTKTQKGTVQLLPYEKELYDRLFDEGSSIKISKLKTKFYKDLKAVKEKLYEQMISNKFFYENPESVRKKYLFIGIGVDMLGVAFLMLGVFLIIGILVAIGAGVIFTGVLLLVFSQVMPRKTAVGREMYRRVRGYELFISTAEKYRQRFFEKKNMFNEILPYAIVFGLTEKFANAFKEMGIEPKQPGWYTGTARFNAAVFGSSIASFSGSLSSAMASAPGGSGFSGSGGFSGGGFGGGGGGSW